MILSLQRRLGEHLRAAWRGRLPQALRTGTALLADGIREIRGGLEAEKNALFSFTAAMEEEFLQLGSLLRKITCLARDVGSRSDEVTAAATGRAEDAAIQFASELLKKAEALVQAGREQYDNVFVVFEKMHVDMLRIARELNSLMRTLSPLEMTNCQFRIQACAFDETTRSTFFALADTIGSIVRDVQTAVAQRFEELERAGEATGMVVAGLTVLATGQKIETERMLAETRTNLSKLNDGLHSSEMAAQSMSEAGVKIAGGVGKAIMALQCQDMARQKFQHIGAAIDEMVGHLAVGCAARLSAVEQADCRHFLTDASRVQLGQLRAVFEQLDAAGRQVGEGLEEIDAAARSLTDHAMRSGAATLDGQIIGQAIQSIHDVLGVIENTVAGIRSVVDLVQKLKSTFNDCTSQILGLTLELRMVALNAQIFAAHVETGAALEVVAQNTRSVAEEAMRQLDGVSLRITELVASVVELEQRLGSYGEQAMREQALLSAESAESEKKLRELERDLRGALSAIASLERELSETIQGAASSIRFPGAVARASARSTALFERIALQFSDASSNGDGAGHHKVKELERNYTMANERLVHEAAVGALTAPGAVPEFQLVECLLEGVAEMDDRFAPDEEDAALQGAAETHASQNGETDEEELADNVELF